MTGAALIAKKLATIETYVGELRQIGRIDRLRKDLRDMAGFRNVLVRGYDVVDLDIVEDVARNHLDDLMAYAASVRRRLNT